MKIEMRDQVKPIEEIPNGIKSGASIDSATDQRTFQDSKSADAPLTKMDPSDFFKGTNTAPDSGVNLDSPPRSEELPLIPQGGDTSVSTQQQLLPVESDPQNRSF